MHLLRLLTGRRLAGICLLVVMAGAWAADRFFPPIAKRGKMEFVSSRTVLIDGKEKRLAVGKRIWNQQNRIQPISQLPQEKIAVNYTEDRHGDIDRVWILSDEEAAQKPEEQKITPSK